MAVSVFWLVAPRNLVEVYQRFRGPLFLITLMMKTAKNSEILVNLYQFTRRYKPEDNHIPD